ncbi:MAG TPA: DUF1801 domain-containing protein [Actinomycetales bacterium]|nr:DUF1801 domain-containing protein [Actinomycetales bacterium]
MAQLKTQVTDESVDDFLDSIEPPDRREDARAVCALMRHVTGHEPRMWGAAMVGFGLYSYAYASGRRGEWFEVGFSPRKQNLTLYLSGGFERYEDLLARLGKHSTGKACLYVKRLANVDIDVLRELVQASVRGTRASQELG